MVYESAAACEGWGEYKQYGNGALGITEGESGGGGDGIVKHRESWGGDG